MALDIQTELDTGPEEPERFILGRCHYCDQPIRDGDDHKRPLDAFGRVRVYVCRGCTHRLSQCDDCQNYFLNGDRLRYINNTATRVCDHCYQNYRECASCGRLGYRYHMTYIDEDWYCDDDCLPQAGGSLCTQAILDFTIPTPSGAALVPDCEVVASLPAGIVSKEGLFQSYNLIMDWLNRLYWEPVYQRSRDNGDFDYCAKADLAAHPYFQAFKTAWDQLVPDDDRCGIPWQTKEGNLPKRLQKALYQQTPTIKLLPEIVTQVGNLCAQNTSKEPKEFTLTLTRDLNGDPGDFYHDGSCWWGSYSTGRCILKHSGGMALRTWDEYGGCTGRIWVLPIAKTLSDGYGVCFNAMTAADLSQADGFLLFNAYGLTGWEFARLLSGILGWTYKTVAGFSATGMYLNEAKSFLVARQPLCEEVGAKAISVTTQRHCDCRVGGPGA